jgi:hypothetical protein
MPDQPNEPAEQDGQPSSPPADEAQESRDFLVPPTRMAAGHDADSAAARGDTGPVSHIPASLQHVDWKEAFPFTHLFHGFRLAIHPSKLLLALAAVLLIYAGSRALDGLWSLLPDRHQPVVGEVELYDATRPVPQTFAEQRGQLRETTDRERQRLARTFGGAEDASGEAVVEGVIVERQRTLARLDGFAEDDPLARRAAYDQAARTVAGYEGLDADGPGIAFYQYSTRQLDQLGSGVLTLDVTGDAGVLTSLRRLLITGPQWAFTHFPGYFIPLLLWTLTILAIFGGAATRIAAVQVARNEKLSLRSALRFSTGKFVSFLSAPLIPVLVIGLTALAVAVVGLVLWLVGLIPGMGWLTDVGVGLLVPIAILAGFIMALTFVGLLGGLSLMYPTIAAEGTDSFDAISRGFSYFFNRPWRLVLYALIALVYGLATFWAVRAFLWLVLAATRAAVGLFVYREAAGRPLIEAIWPATPLGSFSYEIPFVNLTWSQELAAILIAIVVYGALSLLAAYALSLYFSLGTILYFLLRREVDATEPDEVYVDPADEDYGGYSDVPEDPLAEPDVESSEAKPA